MKRILVLGMVAAAALGEDRADRVRELWGVRWHSRVEGALAEAAKAKKPVLHLRILGDLAGDS
jgi:hypothetical protein